MAWIGKVIGMTLLAGVAFVGAVTAKWYHTTTTEQIDPPRGIYGMNGLEIWIDINKRMPNVARQWACYTLLAREEAAINLVRPENAVPYSCQHDFGSGKVIGSAYDQLVNVNILQAMEGVHLDKEPALKACFEAKMAASVTPDQITALNDNSDTDAMTAIVIAASKNARACRQEVGN